MYQILTLYNTKHLRYDDLNGGILLRNCSINKSINTGLPVERTVTMHCLKKPPKITKNPPKLQKTPQNSPKARKQTVQMNV